MVVNELDGMQFSCAPGSTSTLPIPVGALSQNAFFLNGTCAGAPNYGNGYCWQAVCPLQNGNQVSCLHSNFDFWVDSLVLCLSECFCFLNQCRSGIFHFFEVG
jgi:hypothetical protein